VSEQQQAATHLASWRSRRALRRTAGLLELRYVERQLEGLLGQAYGQLQGLRQRTNEFSVLARARTSSANEQRTSSRHDGLW